MKLGKVIKRNDRFGADVGFHFGTFLRKEEGMSSKFQTKCGGVFSFLSILILISASIYFCVQMFNKVNNTVN